VKSELEAIADRIPADPPRSRLEPYKRLILRWKREGRSYRRIRELLAEHFGVKANSVTIYRFVRRRARPRSKKVGEPEIPVPDQTRLFAPKRQRTPEEIAELRAAASVEHHKPVFAMEPDDRPIFDYDPDKPLTNKP